MCLQIIYVYYVSINRVRDWITFSGWYAIIYTPYAFSYSYLSGQNLLSSIWDFFGLSWTYLGLRVHSCSYKWTQRFCFIFDVFIHPNSHFNRTVEGMAENQKTNIISSLRNAVHIYIYIGSICGITVIIVANGHGDLCSNAGRHCLHFTCYQNWSFVAFCLCGDVGKYMYVYKYMCVCVCVCVLCVWIYIFQPIGF